MPAALPDGNKIRRSAGFRHAIAAVVMLCAALPAAAATRSSEAPHVGSLIIGAPSYYETVHEDTLPAVARRLNLGFVELVAANPGVDPWLPGAGVRLRLPTMHILPAPFDRGIIINLAEQRLYYLPRDGGPPRTHPIGAGRAGCETPLGDTRIIDKRKNPSWRPPASIRAERPGLPAVIPPGPDNPLGDHALYLGWPGYIIHGTNKPLGVGRRVSHGCIRLYPEDIASLFQDVAIGTPVRILDQPVKFAWRKGELFLQIHPTQEQADELEAMGEFLPVAPPNFEARVTAAAGSERHRLNWPLVRKAARERSGLVLQVTIP